MSSKQPVELPAHIRDLQSQPDPPGLDKEILEIKKSLKFINGKNEENCMFNFNNTNITYTFNKLNKDMFKILGLLKLLGFNYLLDNERYILFQYNSYFRDRIIAVDTLFRLSVGEYGKSIPYADSYKNYETIKSKLLSLPEFMDHGKIAAKSDD